MMYCSRHIKAQLYGSFDGPRGFLMLRDGQLAAAG